MQNYLARLASCPMMFAVFLLCSPVNGAQASGAHAPSAETVNKDMNITIRQILDDPGGRENHEVTVQGINKGWSGKCVSSAMLTRSDWILEDETGCIYVTGLMMPTGSPADKPLGERITVQGKVILGSAGKPMIKADKVTLVPK